MPSRSAEIFWCSKQLYPFKFLPKTVNFNLSETEYLVFAIKQVIFLFCDHILGQPTEAFWQEVSDGYVKKYVLPWFLFTNEHIKNFESEVMILPIEDIFWLSLFWAWNNRPHIFGQRKIIPIVIDKNCVCSVYVHNLVIYRRNAWKRKRKSEKVCMLKNYYLS